jgi:hypothetical protein
VQRGAELRGVSNRKLKIDGRYFIPTHRTCLVLPDFKIVDAEGKERKIVSAGSTVTLVADASFRVLDRVIQVRPHPELFKLGELRYIPLVAPHDEDVKLEIQFTADQRADLRNIKYIAELYVGE